MSNRLYAAWLLTFAPLLALAAPPAQAGEARFETAVPSPGGRVVHPVVAVGFNPRGDTPTGRWRTELGSPSPLLTLEQAGASFADLRLVVGGGDARAQVETLTLPASACGTRHDVQLYPLVGEVALPPGPCSEGHLMVEALLSDGTLLRFTLDIEAEAPAWREVTPGAIVATPARSDAGNAGLQIALRFPVEVTTVLVTLGGLDDRGQRLRWR